ncbi:MAG: hypothetical protein WC306_02425 [Candidatus Paceibacterota bacterium]|jgi:hypothetical protein
MNQFDYNYLKTEKLSPVWPKGLLTFVLIICLLASGTAFSLNYFNKIQDKKLGMLNTQFQDLRATFPVDQEQEIAIFEKKLTNLEKLLDNHIYFSNVLTLLEQITHSQVYYTSLDYSLEKNSLVLEGIAKNQQILSEAVNGFVNDSKNIKMVILRDMKENNDKTIQFHLELLLQPQVLKYQPPIQPPI